jgi:asparagine synthase (glutamine-hydrolysing)
MSGLCGIVDFAAPQIEPEVLRRMAELSAYRGRDGIGYRFLGGVGFAHLALHATAEEAGSVQPLVDARQQVCVVLDGRLDNRSDLIAVLRPVEGTAVSDAGLVLAAYLKWREACADHLLGDFAFAVWDASERRLLCAVDPLGIKSLYYARVGSLVCFGSDALQVLQHPSVPEGYNEREIAAYLASQVEDPEQSFFKAVHRLAPAQRLFVTPGGFRLERYWSPTPAEIFYPRDEDYAEHFRELFRRAVTDRLRSAGDCVGIAMSGGLDSSSVAAVAHDSRGETGKSIRAYTFVFDRLTDCDERAWSHAMTEELGLEVEPIEAENLWRFEAEAPLPHSPDTPFVGWRTCYQEIFRRMSARGSRVLLMGHGGDDLLRGSSLIYGERLLRGDLVSVREVIRHSRVQGTPVLRALYRHFGRPFLPTGADCLLRSVLGREEDVLLPDWMNPDFAHRIDIRERLKTLRPRKVFMSPARQEVYANTVATPWYWRLANWHDRNAASFGIEVRHPFLDRRLFEFVLAIPAEQLFRLGSTKNLLRRAMAGFLPESVRNRQGKTRFTSFLNSVLRERAKDEILGLLKNPYAARMGFLNGDQLRLAYIDFNNQRTHVSRRALWYAITFEVWLRRCEAVLHVRRQTLAASAAA